ITKMDNLDESERGDVCEFVESKLQQILGKKSLLLQSGATTILQLEEIPASQRESSLYWRANFSALEESLHRELTRNRAAIIAEHLTALLHALLAGLQEAVTSKRSSLAQERAALEGSSIAQLDGVLAALFERCRTEIEQEVQVCQLRIRDYAEAFE